MSVAGGTPLRIEGHRGARGLWPENTLTGFRGALALGVDAIELDVVMTADGVVVASHDPCLNPDLTRDETGAWLAGAGPPLLSLAMAELARFDVGRARPGGVTASLFPLQHGCDGERIPPLRNIMRLARAGRATVDVEIKSDPDQPHLTPHPAVMVEAVVAVARECGTLDRLALRSFDWRALRHARDRWPEVSLSWLTIAGGPGPEQVAHEDIRPGTTWAPGYRELQPGAVERAHALGLLVVPWTVNDPADIERLRGWAVDGICTDRPDLANRPDLARD